MYYDELLPDGIESLLTASYNADVVYGNIISMINHKDKGIFKGEKIDRIRYRMICSHQSMIMRRNTIFEVGLFDLEFKTIADYDMTLRLYLAEKNFAYVDQCVARYNTEGFSSKNPYEIVKEQYLVTKKNKSLKCPYMVYIYFMMRRFIREQKNKIK